MKQTTIKRKVQGIGIGLHKGEPIKISFEPLDANCGIVFYRKDLARSYKVEAKNVINTQMATVIGDEFGYISTVEHLLAAINAYGIDNIRIVLDANEVPVMDGSAIAFCMMLDDAGLVELEANKKALVIKKSVEVQGENKFVRLSPNKEILFDYKIDFKHPIIGQQEYIFEFNKKNFINEIARARTFGFLKDVQMLRAKNLALGGSLENAIVIDENKILNPEGLRFENEFVRHKILDAVGDLSLLGMLTVGKYEALAGSHDLNHQITVKLLSDAANYEVIELSKAYSKNLVKAYA